MEADEFNSVWYHGSPDELTVLSAGSTVTRNRRLAEVFSHKPSIVSVEDDGQLMHDGHAQGYLYLVAEELGPDDIHPHPRTPMEAGLEWLTRRELRLELVGPVEIQPRERLSPESIMALRARAAARTLA